MGMPCQVNSILRLARSQGYPDPLDPNLPYQVTKQGYRILPMDVPLQLVDENWIAHADVMIQRLTWEQQTTTIDFKVVRVYTVPFPLK
jgi:hypothetical protein